ncbi:MAG: antiterminator LoaP [Candidatus Hydrogenedentota bacterium]
MAIDIMTDNCSNWFVIQTYAGKEGRITDVLLDLIKEPARLFFPRRKLYIRKKGEYLYNIKALYPGYLFIKGEDDSLYNLDLCKTIYRKKSILQGFIKILMKEDRPFFCEREEMKVVFDLVNREGIVEESRFYREGEIVKIIEGPLKGYEGIIRGINKRKNRVKVELKFLGVNRLVDLCIFEVR